MSDIRSSSTIDAATYRRVLGRYPTGVAVITAARDGHAPCAMAVGSFSSVSIDPPLISFFPSKRSTSWPAIKAAGQFCVNVLSSEQGELCRRFSTTGIDRFAGLTHAASPNGSPLLDRIVAWIDCAPYAEHEAGDHVIVIGRITDLDVAHAAPPLLFLGGRYGTFCELSDATAD